MDQNIPIIHIADFDNKSENEINESKHMSTKFILIETIYGSNLHKAYKYFTDWINTLENNTLEVSSCMYRCRINISINNVLESGINKYNIVYLLTFGTLESSNVYKVINKLTIDDIENIFDIISLIIKISTGDIAYFSDRSMMALIHMQMDRVGVKVQ